MINKKLLCSVLSLALLVTGCGSAASSTTAADKNIPADTAAAAEASSGAEESSAAESSAAEQSEAPADEAVADVPGTPEEETAPAAEQAAEEVAPEAALMETLSQWSFIFTSGVGAWQTSLDIGKDGTLTGEFTDQNAGESGEGYDGTLWICQFTGRISNPEQTGPDTWKVSFTDLKYNQPSGTEEIEDRLRYAYTDAYGLETGGALEIYLPGAAVENLPEAYMGWISPLLFSGYFQDSFIDDVPDELPFCGIYNPEGEYGFFSVPKDETRNMKFLVNRGSFPGMKNQILEMNEDGTYLCEDMDEGGMHLVRNLCFRVPEDFPSMYSDPEGFCRGSSFYESKMADFESSAAKVCSDLPRIANSSKTTRLLLRSDYESLPQLAAFCSDLPFRAEITDSMCAKRTCAERGKTRRYTPLEEGKML